MSCALGSIEHIEVVATIAAFVEHCDLGFQDRRLERSDRFNLSVRASHAISILTHVAHITSRGRAISFATLYRKS